jgi:molybdate transport system permease protein
LERAQRLDEIERPDDPEETARRETERTAGAPRPVLADFPMAGTWPGPQLLQRLPAPLARQLARRWHWPRIAVALAALPLLLFFLLPLVALIARIAPGNLLPYLADRHVAQALQVSFATTLTSLALTLLAGTPVAYLLARYRFPGHGLLDTLLDLPMVLPPAVAGIALLVAFGRTGLLGHPLAAAGAQIAFTQLAVVLAQTFVAAPFYVRTAASAFAGVERELEQVAAVDGASPLAVFARITLPLTAPALLGGAVMTWARALGEFGATLLFAGNFPGITQTMPLAIYIGFEQDLGVSITLSVILLIVSFGVLFLMKAILRQRIAGGVRS